MKKIYIKYDSNNHLFDYCLDGKKGYINFSDLTQYCDIEFDDIDDYYARYISGNLEIVLSGFDGQWGLICVWDINNNKFVHVSNGECCLRTLIKDNKVYSLCSVEAYGVEQHFELSSIDFGVIDSSLESDTIIDDLKIDFNPYEDQYSLENIDDKISIVVNDEIIKQI